MIDISDDKEREKWENTERILFNNNIAGVFNIQYYRHVYARPEVYFVTEQDYKLLMDNTDLDEVLKYLRANYPDDALN